MAYNTSKLIKDVRIYLGGVSETKLPESIIVYYGDFYDDNPKYTGKYPYILWKATLACLDYLMAYTASSTSSAAKSSRKEKVGDVEVTVTEDSSSASATSVSYKSLYEDYSENPWKFGINDEIGSLVLINGVNQAEVDKYRNDQTTTSIYNPLPTIAFPKITGETWRRNNSCGGGRR
tara:strand:+ start:356 stop:886 length:531 start_codon:yes stop_codon:yes gene_type:complete